MLQILTVIIMYATWTSVFSIGKLTLSVSPPIFLTAARMLLAGIILTGFCLIFKRSAFKMKLRAWFSIGVLAIFSIYLTNVFEFWGLQHLSSAKTCFIYSLSPFFAALFSYIHFKEKMTKKKWIGMGIGFLGFLPVLFTRTGSEDTVGGFFIFSWPELAIMGAALCSVYGWVLLRLAVKDQNIPTTMANGISMLIGGFLAFIHSLLIDTYNPLPVASGNLVTFTQGILVMTFVSNIVCYNLYGYLLKRFTATFLSFMGLLSPIFASFTGWLLLGEAPSLTIFLSTSIVSLGLWIVYQAELKQGYIQKKEKDSSSEPAALAE